MAAQHAVFDLIDAGDLDGFCAGVTNSAEINLRSPFGRTVLIACVEAGQLAMAAHALSVGASATERIAHIMLQNNESALRRAIERPRPEMVKLLLAHGATLDEGDTPLAWLSKGAPPGVLAALTGDRGSSDDPRAEILRILEQRFGSEAEPVVTSTAATSTTPRAEGDPQRGEPAVLEAIRAGDEMALEQALAAMFPEGRVQKKLAAAKRAERETRLAAAFDAALEKGAPSLVALVLAFGATPNIGDETPLHQAVKERDVVLVRLLLAHGANANQWIEDWSYPAGPPHASPISMAADNGDLELLELLLDSVKKPAQAKERMPGVDPLAVAGSREVADLLLARGTKLTDEAVAHFLRQGWLDTVRAALGSGAIKLGKPFEGERSSLDQAIASGAPRDVVERLIGLGVQPIAPFPRELSQELAACLAKHGVSSPALTSVWEIARLETTEDILRFVAERGGHETATAVLAHAGRHDAVAAVAEVAPAPAFDKEAGDILGRIDAELGMRLLERWKIRLNGPRGTSLLGRAIESHHAKLVQAMLAAGARMIEPPAFDATLYCAARSGKPDVLAACLAHARPPFELAEIWLYACAREKTPADDRDALLVRLLAEAPDPPEGGLSDLAIAAGHAGCIAMLEEAIRRDAAALLPRKNEENRWHSPLHGAVSNGHLVAARFCLERGADTNTIGPDGLNVLSTAIEKGQLEVAQLLISSGANVNAIGPNGQLPLGHASTDEAWALLRKAGCRQLYWEE